MFLAIHKLAASVVLALTLASSAFGQGKPMRALVVTEPVHGIGYLPLYVAMRNGYFADEGLEIKIVTIESGSAPTNAVLTGQAFAYIAGPEHNAFAKLKGAELRLVVNVVARGNLYYVAAKGLGCAKTLWQNAWACHDLGDVVQHGDFVEFGGFPVWNRP